MGWIPGRGQASVQKSRPAPFFKIVIGEFIFNDRVALETQQFIVVRNYLIFTAGTARRVFLVNGKYLHTFPCPTTSVRSCVSRWNAPGLAKPVHNPTIYIALKTASAIRRQTNANNV